MNCKVCNSVPDASVCLRCADQLINKKPVRVRLGKFIRCDICNGYTDYCYFNIKYGDNDKNSTNICIKCRNTLLSRVDFYILPIAICKHKFSVSVEINKNIVRTGTGTLLNSYHKQISVYRGSKCGNEFRCINTNYTNYRFDGHDKCSHCVKKYNDLDKMLMSKDNLSDSEITNFCARIDAQYLKCLFAIEFSCDIRILRALVHTSPHSKN